MKLPSGLSALLSEQDCYLCGAIATRPVCRHCEAAFPALPPQLCPVCALPSPENAVCGRCLRQPPQFDATRAALAYGAPLDYALQAYKYRHALGLTRFFSTLLAQAIGPAPQADLIIPMPLAPARLAERGFNQALELARPVAARHKLKLDATIAHRIRDTPPQAALPWKERARNITGVFSCPARLDGLRVAVVDDVMTTGATLNELARVLKGAGAVHVSNWVVARTLPRSNIDPAQSGTA